MTPSEKPDAQGSNGASASPPWQRVGKDSGAAEPDAPASSGLVTDDVLYSGNEQGGQRANEGGDYPVVSGSAARRLFGGEAEGEPAAAPSAARTRSTPTALRRPGRGPRRASLQIKRFDPWSVLKLALVLGVAMFFVWLVAVGVLYTVLDGMGVWDKLNGTYSSLVGGEGANASAEPLISAGRVFGIAAILGAINIVLVSALATVSAFIYNVSADLAGGLEVTLSERE
ncbi:DUF3566 domain-containing protein [Amycolatopsis samaneae]|uniref:DUF3566 domain-containing protein n=1 Tax=Amycolatopsis samaneae TaxID=664691 RepID=A0ABW5GK01_9PSEU